MRVRLLVLQARDSLPMLQGIMLLRPLHGKQDHRGEDEFVVLVGSNLLMDEISAVSQILHMVRDLGSRVTALDEVRMQ